MIHLHHLWISQARATKIHAWCKWITHGKTFHYSGNWFHSGNAFTVEKRNISRNNRRLKSASSLNSRLKIGRTFLIISRTLAISTALVVFPYPLLLTASLSLNTALSLTFIAKQGCGEKGQQQLCQEPLNARIISEKDPPVSKLHTTSLGKCIRCISASFQRVVFCIN